MNNFKKAGPGGLRNRAEFVGGRPKSDADYSTKKKFGKKSSHGNDRGGDRGNRGGRGGFGGNRGGERRETEMFKTTCTACGKAAEVPFRPDGSKPVLCRDCFAKKADDRDGFGKRDRFSNDRGDHKPRQSFAAPRPERGPSPEYKALLTQVTALEDKVNEMLTILKTAAVPTPVEDAPVEMAKAPAKEKKPKKVATKKVAKKVAKKVTKKVAKKTVKK